MCTFSCIVGPAHAGAATSDHERRIIVAIAERPDPAPVVAGTSRGYGGLSGYSASTRNRLTSADIARDHQLVEIANWNIDLLHLHCTLFEMPVGVERNALLVRLRNDRRVRLAQPQQAFYTLNSAASGT
ncbi:MAG: hypothetical protein R3F00_05955 [Dokdonella sp.]